MLSQENINKILKERVLSKTAADGDPWYAKAKNWATADNYSNLKNIGIGAGTAALAGGATYAASGLIPGLKKKRLARALIALTAGGAAGGAAGYYGKDIRNFDYGKLNPWRDNTANRAKAQAKAQGDAASGHNKTQSFRGYHPSRNLYMNKRAGLWDDAKGTLKALYGVGEPDYSIRTDGDTTHIQYDFAKKPTLEQIRSFDGSKGGKGTHTNKYSIKEMQAREEARKSGKQYPNWFTANNYSNLKDIGIGVGTGALTYGATGLIPGLKKKRLARALIALTAGGAAGYYGSNIRGQA